MHRELAEQVVVITGASSGIGRETALQFGHMKARVVAAARNQEALDEVAAEINRMGGQCEAMAVDVSRWQEVQGLAQRAVGTFGRIDTWINNAAVSEYATVDQMTADEIARIVEVNLLGAIYGCKAAFAEMKAVGSGTIISVASALAMRGVPLQSAYCATKHGIKGFTDSFRLEVEQDYPGIHVCLVMPSSINTPLFDHARSKLGRQPMPIPPVYEPSAVAGTLLSLAVKPRRDVIVGGSGKLLTLVERLNPGMLDWYMKQNRRMVKNQVSDKPIQGPDNLFAPEKGLGATTGDFGNGSKSSSLYTRALEMHPARKNLLAVGAVVGAAALTRRLFR